MSNAIAQTKLSTKDYFNSPIIQEKMQKILGDNTASFTASVLQAVSSNYMLKDATPESVFMAAMTAATLDLPINNNLGFAYLVPYSKSKGKDRDGRWINEVEAQFQLGYKGYIQLAQRSGQFKAINACPIYDGDTEQSIHDRLTMFLPPEPPSAELIGYIGYFKLLNGFEAHVTMRLNEIKAHAMEYSQAYQSGEKDQKKQKFSPWHKHFDVMAKKTVLKMLISKQAPMSIDSKLVDAVQADQAVIRDVNGETHYDYPDNQPQQAAIEMDISDDPNIFATVKTSIANGNLDKRSVLDGSAGYTISNEQRQELLAS